MPTFEYIMGKGETHDGYQHLVPFNSLPQSPDIKDSGKEAF